MVSAMFRSVAVLRPLTRTSSSLPPFLPNTTTRNLRPLFAIKLRSMATKHSTLQDVIAEDHREIYAYYDKYVECTGNPDQQARWARQFIWEIARHSIGEEIVVYPLFEKHLGAQGKQMADGDRNDHQYVKNCLYKLENLKPGTEEHAALMRDTIEHLRPHAENEESKDLPVLEKAIGAEASASAAGSFQRTKKFVPTRSHPSAPDKPPFETLAGLLAAPMDKLKDMFSKFPSAEEKEAAKHTHN